MKGSGPLGSGGYSHRKKRCGAKSQDASDFSPEVLFLPGCDYLVKSMVISSVSIPKNVSPLFKKIIMKKVLSYYWWKCILRCSPGAR